VIRVALVDDQELVRTGFRMMLDAQPDMQVVGEAADGAAAVELARREPVDVMVMDVRMPRLDGVAATRQVCAATVKTHVGRILAKLSLRDRVQAVVLAYETGLVRARTPR
jgi:DNA-binding NarL/FixJ family response regulator